MKGKYSVVKIDPTDLGQEKFEQQPGYENITLEDAQASVWALETACRITDRIYIVVDEHGKPIPDHVQHIYGMRDHLIDKIQRQIKRLQDITY